MDKIKINLDREKLSSEYIHSKQDFTKVQSQVTAMPKSIFKSTWFYGTIGMASVAVIVMVTSNNSKSTLNDSNTTLSQTTKLDTKQEALADANPVNAFSASENQKESTEITKAPLKSNTILEKKKTALAEKIIDSTLKPEIENSTPIISTSNKEIVKSTTEEKLNYYPRINGVYNGEISQGKLCGAGIDVNSQIYVTSFTIYYSTNRGDKTTLIEGNRLPEGICKEMEEYGIDQMIFLTHIIGMDKKGKLYNFTSMNLTALMD